MWRVVKVDDTAVGVEAGRNAGTWSVGVTRTGNQIGLSEAEVNRLEADELAARIQRAEQDFVDAGAHFTIESVGELPEVLDEIESRLGQGERP